MKRFTVLLAGHLETQPENISRLLDGFAQLQEDLLHYKLAVKDAALTRYGESI